MTNSLDVSFDYRSESGGRDIDKYSPTLKKHHQLLWAKPLPSGQIFDLKRMPKSYLVFRSDNLVHSLTSDQISNSFRSTKRMKHITDQVSEDALDEFQCLGSTVAGTILFPGKQVNRKPTINQARGLSNKVGDRFDLTLECIRLHYLGFPNPLEATFEIYWAFFELFETFDQYVEFFLLQDLVQDGKVKFFLGKGDFRKPALPQDFDQYIEYMANTVAFLNSRKLRIRDFSYG